MRSKTHWLNCIFLVKRNYGIQQKYSDIGRKGKNIIDTFQKYCYGKDNEGANLSKQI